MTLFDKNGNLIPNVVNYEVKHDDKTIQEIRDATLERKENSKVIKENEKRSFYCHKHKTFHKYLYHGKPSKTYQKCLLSKDFFKFTENMKNSEIFNIKFKKSLTSYNVKSHKSRIGSRKQ